MVACIMSHTCTYRQIDDHSTVISASVCFEKTDKLKEKRHLALFIKTLRRRPNPKMHDVAAVSGKPSDVSTQNNQNPQQPITPSQQRATQTVPAHLHRCGANPPGPWPSQAAIHGDNAPKRDSHFCHFRAFSSSSKATRMFFVK